MLCKNTGTATACFTIDAEPGKSLAYEVPPGESVEIPDGYCRAFTAPTRKLMKPIITQLNPNMVPLPGQYAPGMTAERHAVTGVSPQAQAQIDLLTSQVQQLTALVKAQMAVPAPRAPVADVEVDDSADEEPGEFDADDEEVATLVKQSKADLMQIASEMGAKVESRMSKVQVAEAILAKRAELGEE